MSSSLLSICELCYLINKFTCEYNNRVINSNSKQGCKCIPHYICYIRFYLYFIALL